VELEESGVTVTAVEVPHRAEFSNTFGFVIEGKSKKKLLYLPDVDHWEFEIDALLEDCDYCLLDGTFYSGAELPGRDLTQIPHPFVAHSVERFAALKEKTQIYFTHFNHSNPCCQTDFALPEGFHTLQEKQTFDL
jgi:pyrroloquinoline quinone biosynthesis protein B